MATLVRWSPWNELAGMHNEMSRLMNGLLEGNGRTTQSWVPALDVWETENEIVYAFDLPGIPEDKIQVEFEDGSLTVSAERDREQQVSDDRYFRLSAASAPSRARSACRMARTRARSTPTTRTACSRSTFVSPSSRSRAGSKSAPERRRRSRARRRRSNVLSPRTNRRKAATSRLSRL